MRPYERSSELFICACRVARVLFYVSVHDILCKMLLLILFRVLFNMCVWVRGGMRIIARRSHISPAEAIRRREQVIIPRAMIGSINY